MLKAVPDLERVLARIHIGACKLKDFLEVLAAFELTRDTVQRWQSEGVVAGLASSRLQQLLSKSFPDVTAPLTAILDSFDRKQAASEGLRVDIKDHSHKISNISSAQGLWSPARELSPSTMRHVPLSRN